MKAPYWFGTRDDRMGYWLLYLQQEGLPIPNVRLRLDPRQVGAERVPDPLWTAEGLLDVWQEAKSGLAEQLGKAGALPYGGVKVPHKPSLEAVAEIQGRGAVMRAEKARIYLQPGEEPPTGVDVKEGPRGGHYYEDGGRGDGGEPKPMKPRLRDVQRTFAQVLKERGVTRQQLDSVAHAWFMKWDSDAGALMIDIMMGRKAAVEHVVAQGDLEAEDAVQYIKNIYHDDPNDPYAWAVRDLRPEVLAAVRDASQAALKQAGVTKLPLYRGISGKMADGLREGKKYRPRPMESWTTKQSFAEGWAAMAVGEEGAVVSRTIPVEQVFLFSDAVPNLRRFGQHEVVVMRGKGDMLHLAKGSGVRLMKARVYLKPGEKPPKGATVKTGPKGGKYYETEGARTLEIDQRQRKYAFSGILRSQQDSLTEGGRLDVYAGEARVHLKKEIIHDLAGRMEKALGEGAEEKLGAAFEAGFGAKQPFEPDTPAEAVATRLVGTWALTSSNGNPVSVAMQRAVASEFGLEDTTKKSTTKRTDREADLFAEAHGDVIKAFVRGIYDATQEFLKKAGIGELVLARGMGWYKSEEIPEWVRELPDGKPAKIEVGMNPMSSFSTEFATARSFARQGVFSLPKLVMVVRVPRERVFSTFRTGLGCAAEFEVVVLGGESEVVAVKEEYEAMPPTPGMFGEAIRSAGLELAQDGETPFIDEDLANADWPKRTNDVFEFADEDVGKAVVPRDQLDNPDQEVHPKNVAVKVGLPSYVARAEGEAETAKPIEGLTSEPWQPTYPGASEDPVQERTEGSGSLDVPQPGGRMKKGRHYLGEGAEPPKGKNVEEGPRGGRYYEEGKTKQYYEERVPKPSGNQIAWRQFDIPAGWDDDKLVRQTGLWGKTWAAAERVRKASEELLRGAPYKKGTPSHDAAAYLLNKIRQGDQHDLLYRGMSVSGDRINSLLDDFKEGEQILLPVSSFTRSERVARNYAGSGEAVPVFVVVKDAQAADVDTDPKLEESVSAGRFAVVSVRRRAFAPTKRFDPSAGLWRDVPRQGYEITLAGPVAAMEKGTEPLDTVLTTPFAAQGRTPEGGVVTPNQDHMKKVVTNEGVPGTHDQEDTRGAPVSLAEVARAIRLISEGTLWLGAQRLDAGSDMPTAIGKRGKRRWPSPLELVNMEIGRTKRRMARHCAALWKEEVDLDDFEILMQREIDDLYGRAASAAIRRARNIEGARARARDDLLVELRDQRRYLAGFRADLATKGITQKRLVQRAKMYTRGAAGLYHSIVAGALPQRKAYWRLAKGAAHCSDCIEMAEKSPWPSNSIPRLPGDGTTKCITGCRCYLEYGAVARARRRN